MGRQRQRAQRCESFLRPLSPVRGGRGKRGNANSLMRKAYASDGYARVKGTLAVVITTFGVGELSALW